MAEKTLFNATTKPTEEDISLVEKKEPSMEARMYKPEVDTKELLQELQKRFRYMDDSRPDEDWDIRLAQFYAAVYPREDGLANTNLPIEFAVIRSKKADLQSSKTIVELQPTEEDDIPKRELMQEIWDYVWLESDTEKEITKAWDTALIFGTCPWFEGIRKEIFTRYEPVYHKDGTIEKKKVVYEKSWLTGYPLDIRDVWMDPVPDIEYAADCFIAERNLTREQIEGLKQDPNFDAAAIDAYLAKCNPKMYGAQNSHQSHTFSTREEQQRSTKTSYTLFHYYNKQKGLYIVVDEDIGFVLRNGANPFPHGELPISFLIDIPRYNEMYGIGECELLESTKYERNMIRNQMLDMAKFSNTANLLVGSGIELERQELIGGIARIWNVDGDLNQARFLNPPSQDSSLANMDELLRSDAVWISGIDINALAGSPTKTAFEARLQEQTKLKGVMVTMRQFDYFMTRVARQRLANIQAFLPITTGKKILGKEMGEKLEGKTRNRRISFADKQLVPINGVDVKTGKLKEIGQKLEHEEGSIALLELKPSLLRNNFDVSVRTPTTTPILRELDRQNLQDVMNSLMQIAQTPQGQEILSMFDFEQYYEDLIKERGFDPNKYMKQEAQEAKMKKLRQELLQDMPAPPMTKSPRPQNPRNPMQQSPQGQPGQLGTQGMLRPATPTQERPQLPV